MRKERYIFSLFLAGAFAVAATSCIKDNSFMDRKTENVVPKDGTHGPHSFKISAGHEDSENGNTSSRAYLDVSTYQYYWSPGDKVGMTIAPLNSTNPGSLIAQNVLMTGENTANALHTNFSGTLNPTQLNALSSSSTYDYYSYYPYNSSLGGTFPNIQFSIPSSLTLTPNVFNPNYAPMVAVQTNKPPIIYLAGQTLTHSELVHFDYNHIMSYAAIEMDVSLLNQRQITQITMSVNGGVLISGTYNYNMATGSAGYAAGSSSSITINITGGLTVGSGNVLYVPMPPINMTGRTFTFSFQVSGTNKYENVTVPGITFQRGKIHKLKVAPVVRYISGEEFTTTKAGYYYIEAFGANGGNGSGSNGSRTGGTGGAGATVRGLYYFASGATISVQIGAAAPNATGRNQNMGGGSVFGMNYALGNGGNGDWGGSSGGDGNAGAGGGGASGIRNSGAIVMVAGGGGGGGGASAGSTFLLNPSNGGNGGNGGTITPNAGSSVNNNGGAGGRSGNAADGYGGLGNGTGGNRGSGSGGNGNKGTDNSGANGGHGGTGSSGSGAYTSGSGGGGAGGGYHGGGGGGGGDRINLTSGGPSSGAGGGGAGGASYSIATSTYSGSNPYSPPVSSSRPNNNGYVVITFIR